MPPRRRSTSLRRPRVAGLTTARRADGESRPAGGVDTVVDERPQDGAQPGPDARAEVREDAGTDPDAAGTAEVPSAPAATGSTGAEEEGSAAEGASAEPRVRRRLSFRPPALRLLAGAFVVFLGLAVFFGIMDHSVRNSPAASNTALVDVAATAEAAGQLGDALETIYSYDFARLEENKRAADAVITPGFQTEFDALWSQVQELAPQQQAVVTATVTHSAVKSIEGDRAVVVVFMDQQATRTAEGAEAQQLSSAGRITVTGERVDGRWKIADVEVR